MKPILLQLNPVSPERLPDPSAMSLEQLERDFDRLMTGLTAVIAATRRRTIYVTSELLMQAVEMLMPPERMGVLGGRQIGNQFVMCSLHDVTGHGHMAHVTADPNKMARALLMMERAGSTLAGWIHSHPGYGVSASAPSGIDRRQYVDWVHDYSDTLVGVIVTRDGYVRFWGDAVETGRVRVEVVGDGARVPQEGPHVLRLAR